MLWLMKEYTGQVGVVMAALGYVLLTFGGRKR